MHRHLITCFLGIFLLVTSAAAQSKSAAATKTPEIPTGAKLPSEETINGFLQQTFGYDPTVTWKIVSVKPAQAEGLAEVTVLLSSTQGKQNSKFYVTSDGQHALLGDIIPFGTRPFAAAHEALSKGMNGPVLGPADAPVAIVEFSDLQCPYCKQAQPKIDKLISEEKNARLVFQNFPLPAHTWAGKGADYADCVGRASGEAFWKFLHAAFEAQNDITPENADEKLTGLADQAGVKGADVAACAGKPETAARLQHSIALGTSVDVNGTPTLFVNGRKISNVGSNDTDGIPYDVLKSLVDFAAKEGK